MPDRLPLKAGYTQKVQPAESTETGRSLCCGVALCTSHVKAVAQSRINVHCLVACALLSNRRVVPLSRCGSSMPWCHSHWASVMSLKFRLYFYIRSHCIQGRCGATRCNVCSAPQRSCCVFQLRLCAVCFFVRPFGSFCS